LGHLKTTVQPIREQFFALPMRHVDVLYGAPFDFSDRLRDIENAINANGDCALDILHTGLRWVGLESLMEYVKDEMVETEKGSGELRRVRQAIQFDRQTQTPCIPGLNPAPELVDYSKVSTTIRHLYREWSVEGADERAKCFAPIVDYLDKFYENASVQDREKIKVLNPGSGLGRFNFDLTLKGFDVTGIEIAYQMLLGSMHILNFTSQANQYKIHPFVMIPSNHHSHQDRVRHVTVPDIHPSLAQAEMFDQTGVNVSDRIGMATGDFSVVYNQEEYKDYFDVVAMVFFLDTAKNPLAYFESVVNCLKPGGLWINLGPLKWHWQDSYHKKQSSASKQGDQVPETQSADHGVGNPGMVMLNEDDIMGLLKYYGFKVIHYEDSTRRPTGYIHDPRSMESNMYYPTFWVAQKVDDLE
jgi:carnosine N-methyltransferase